MCASSGEPRANLKRVLLILLPSLAALALLVFPTSAPADPPPGTIVVGTTADGTGSCTLRDAIASANSGSAQGGCASPPASGTTTIEVPAGNYGLADGQLSTSSDVNILGAGARSTVIQNLSSGDRVLEVSSGTVSIGGVTVEGGSTTGVGGGVLVDSGGTLTLQDSMVSSNSAGLTGGGIENDGSLTILRSTIENDSAGTSGGGIDDLGPSLSITNSTIMGNQAGKDGGGLFLGDSTAFTNDTIANNRAGTTDISGVGGGAIAVAGGTPQNAISLSNTILAGNTWNGDAANCSTTNAIDSLGGNLDQDGTCDLTGAGDQSGVDPLLGTVDTSGPTDVLPLKSHSPAIDAANDLACPQTDQRYIARPQGSGCDIGAYESTTGPSDYYVSTADELDSALSSAGLFEVPATIHIAAGHYDLGTLVGQENFGSDPGSEITLSGADAATTILDGDHLSGDVLFVGGTGTTTIKGVTVEDATNTGIDDEGLLELDDSIVQNNADVGIQDENHGLILSGSTISGNGNPSLGVDTQFNGGIFSESGNLTVVNSTVTGNNGSGIYQDSSPGLSLQNVTIAGNLGVGLDLHSDGGTAVNSIIANNTSGDCTNVDTQFNWTSENNNLDSDGSCNLTATSDLPDTNPQLGPLQDNGGPTLTMALASGSPAVDHGDDTSCPAVDQRGITRPQGPHCDIGAFELVPVVGPQISGSLSAQSQQDANLTALGNEDWAVWGFASQGTSTSLAPDVRKSGGSAISNLTDIDPTGVPLRGIGQFGVGQLPFGFDWSDGSGPASATGAAAGLQNNGLLPSSTTTNGDGFSFTVPADTSVRTVTVFASEHWGTGTLTATLSDGSAQPYTASVASPAGDANFGGNEPGVFTIDYAAASPGQHLTVSWVETGDNCAAAGHCDNAAIYAVALSDPLSNLTVNATPSSAGAGIDQVPISTIPNAWLSFFAGGTNSTPVGSTPVGSTPVGSTPVGSTPVGSTPVGSTPVGSTPVGSTPVGSTPVGSTGLFDLPVGSTPVGSTALSSVLLSQVQLHGVTWDQILCGSLATKPLTAITLQDLKTSTETCTDGKTSLQHFEALTLQQVDLTTTLLKSVHWATLLMGNTPLASLPGGFDAWCGTNGLIPSDGGSCSNATGATTVLQMDVAGQLGSAPVGSTPVGSTPVGSTPVGSTPVGSTDVSASLLANISLSDIANDDGDLSSVVDCTNTKVNCSTGTLGDAYTANAILSTATFADLANAMAANNITIDDLVVAIIGAAGFPWEQLPIQGLQPYSATKSTVHYTISADVDCTIVSQLTFTAHLPDGFFPVDGSAQIAFGNNAPTSAGTAAVLGQDAASAQKLNSYRWTVGCPAGGTANETAAFTFDSWVGLDLGTFTMGASAAAPGAGSISATGAPVTVHQNAEAGDPTTANAIQPNTLVVGHIADSGEQAFYKVNLGGLPQGTRLQAFLNVPSDADLDLTISAPAAPSFFSTPVGSTPVGSTPIEDNGVGFAGIGQGLSPDTLEDVPVGSTPVGSTPVGSTPVGSTSDARGDGVNEAGAIITSGQSGFATIGVSGYNGASSNKPFVLRVQETPPPALPACPARTFANGAPSSFTPGTLPNTLPTSTKSLFIVDKQRLTAMYGASAVTSLLSSLNTLAARSEVSGTVLDVDGNVAVRSAYSAWDATPCNTTARNNVVTAINNVVATYRNSTNGLPNLHYIVLVGSDEATPMANVPDPVTLSPEENEAADLAFTTNGLTKGNALYASAAQNNILTDGAYGAFTAIPWLGSNLLLPQISVSRLVETPTDIIGQINRYLGNNGISAPQTAAGTLKPTSALVTGYDFLADGAKAVHDNLKANFAGLSTLDSFASGDPAINFPGFPNPWNASDVLTGALQSSSAPSIVSVDGHYNQYELESASGDLANTGQVTANLAARILFTMGCHGGLNISDTFGSPTTPVNKYLDWPELYARDQAAMYIANTGYGYGDSDSVALSERLLALFAKNLHSDSGSVGEEWVDALQQYFATAGDYDVYDQKVMEETTFYGLPFWHFSTAGSSPTFTPLTTTTDPITGTQSATVSFPASGDTTQSQFGLYRPILPITSQQVTSSLPARGVWIKNLASADTNANATIGYPTIDSTAHEPAPAISPIFFPASPFTLEHSLAFGTERDYLNVSDQFRPTGPGDAGVQRHFNSGTFEIFYSQNADPVAPLISEVNVSTSAGVATISTRVTDSSNPVAEVAALVNDGTPTGWHYLQLSQSPQDPTLWTGTIGVAEDPEVFVEATDGTNVSYSANKGENFTSTNSAPPAGPQILIASPVGPYGAHANVIATYTCPGAVSCVGSVPSGSPIDTSPGQHTFLVTATDADGNVTTLQRTYAVGDLALSLSISPSTAHAGSAVVLKASLTNTSSAAQTVTASGTFALGTKYVVKLPPVTFTLGAGKTIAVSLPFVVLKNTPKGTYAVTLRASDASGPVAATATLTVN
jgi:Right handed beta helix region